MITEHDLKEAIAECQGVLNPNANTCIKLASYLTILEHMQEQASTYSYAPPAENVINYTSGTEFSETINGKNMNRVLEVIDEMMSVLQVTNPRLYDAVLYKL